MVRTMYFARCASIVVFITTMILLYVGTKITINVNSDATKTNSNVNSDATKINSNVQSDASTTMQHVPAPPSLGSIGKVHSCPYIPDYSITICIHPPKEDFIISKALSQGKLFGRENVEVILQWLDRHPDLYLLDIGANIGAVTIPAAARGHRVLAFEPFPPNLQLLALSITMNALQDKVSVFEHGISDGRYTMNMEVRAVNKGRVKLSSGVCNNTECSRYTASTITLDDFIEMRPDVRKIFMKLDAEGQERPIILGADKFWTQVEVHAILMEWEWFSLYFSGAVDERAHTEKMIERLFSLGFRPYTLDGRQQLDRKRWSGWGLDVLWVNESIQKGANKIKNE